MAAVGLLAAAGAAILVWVPWLAVPASLVAGALIGTLVDEFGPVTAERVVGIEPMGVHLGADGAAHGDGWRLYMAVDHLREDQPTFADRPSVEEVRSWFVDRGAYDVDASQLRLSLVGRSREPAQITEIRARILNRPKPGRGVFVKYPSAGENPIRAVELDLDAPEPRLLSEGQPYFRHYTLTVAHREVLDMRIAARTSGMVEWDLEIEYTWGGAHRIRHLDNDGQPFRTVGNPDVTQMYVWNWGKPRPSLELSPPPPD